jgi:hypothetical protein
VATFRGLDVLRPSSLPVSAEADPANAAEYPASPGGKRIAMRKYLVLSVLGVCLLVLAPGTAAFAGSGTTPSSPTPTASPTPTPTPTTSPPPNTTTYAGKNSQGQRLRFAVVHTASGPKFDPILLTQIVRCPVTGETLGVGDSFGGFRVPIRNGKFNFALNEFGHLLRWSGTVTSTGASGTESIHLASFDKEGGLQDCNAGSLSWTAKAVSPGSSAAAAPSMAYVVKFTKASDGSVHLSVTH